MPPNPILFGTFLGALVLTDLQVRKAKPAERDYKLADSGGLYPEVTLDAARKLRDEARQQLRDFRDPAVEKRKLAASAAAMETFKRLAACDAAD